MATILATDYTWQLGDTGVLLNSDLAANTAFVDIEKVTGFDGAPIRISKRDHEGVDGGFVDAELEQGRDITLAGTVYSNGQPLEPYLDTIKANWAGGTSLVPLYFYNAEVGQRLVMVKPLGCVYDVDTLRRTGMTAIVLSCFAEDPRIYDNNQTTVVIPVGATIFTGFSFPLGFSFGFGGVSTTTDGQYLIVAGNRPTPATLTLTGPLTNPVVYNDTTSNIMGFTATLNTGETLVVDTYYRTVRFGGVTNRRSWLTLPGWFQLQPPQVAPNGNFIRFRAQAGTGTLTVQYRSAWR